MKRKHALEWMRVAGYHGDSAAFTRLLIENRVSKAAADAEWSAGRRAREAGMPCSCTDCRANPAA